MAEQPLSLTLEEIFHGGMKQVECIRTIVDGVSGYDMPVTELVHVRITPGIREGTRCASSRMPQDSRTACLNCCLPCRHSLIMVLHHGCAYAQNELHVLSRTLPSGAA